MGAWGPGSFENDAAADWALECARSADLSLIEATLDNLLAAEPDELDASDAEEAIAAAELAAHAAGRYDGVLPKPLQDWIGGVGERPSSALLAKAHHTVRRVRDEPSELRELWAESDELQAWLASLDGLLSRLAG